jgi:hypothetical protein
MKFYILKESISISVMDKIRVESQKRSGWVLRKPYAPAYGFKKHASFAPARQKRLGFRLRSPLPSGEEPCPLRLQTVFYTHKPSQNRDT